jgi:hypothetical protein
MHCEIHIHMLSEKNLQVTRSLTHWILAKSSTLILLYVDIMHYMETICKLKIYSTSLLPICAHDTLNKKLIVVFTNNYALK